jgi:signal peptidase
MVAIESGSMEHNNNPPFGRYGTIDAGDMVLLVKVNTKDDIVPRGSSIHGTMEREDKENYFYGDYGDVIVYHPYGQDNTDQIIHRAMCWVECNEDGTYTVMNYQIINQESITIPELGLQGYTPSHSGFITKGDNNDVCDQTRYELCKEPIKVAWISGKARSEIPWIGTINLFFNDITSGGNTVGNVHSDSIWCLAILIAILISIPIILDVYDYYKNKKKNPPMDDYIEPETYPDNKIDPSAEEIEKHIDENL